MNTISEMSLNPTYDFEISAELLEDFSFDSPSVGPEAQRQVSTEPEFVAVTDRDLEDANAALGRMLDDFLAESGQKAA